LVSEAAEGEGPKGEPGSRTSSQLCGRSSGGAGGSSPPSGAERQSAGSDAERARTPPFPFRARDHPSVGRCADARAPQPPRRERDRGERPTRMPASRGGRLFLPSGVWDRMPPSSARAVGFRRFGGTRIPDVTSVTFGHRHVRTAHVSAAYSYVGILMQ
jgi:hypothetical protein